MSISAHDDGGPFRVGDDVLLGDRRGVVLHLEAHLAAGDRVADQRGRGLFRAMYYLPGVTSAVAVAVVWKWIFNGDFGLINYYLMRMGLISEPIRWLTDPALAMPSVIIVSIINLRLLSPSLR